MTDTTEEKPKRISRVKKAVTTNVSFSTTATPPLTKPLVQVCDSLAGLMSATEKAKREITELQEKVVETQKTWADEQKEHDKMILGRDKEEELARKREIDEYGYQTKVTRRKVEDDFNEKRLAWERDLQQKKDEIAEEKKELTELRARVGSFDTELQKTIKEAQNSLAKELEEKYTNERKLREQEVKSEKEILNLKITSLTVENNRQGAEITALKKALDEATLQIKEIAVKVIEGRTPKIVGTSDN